MSEELRKKLSADRKKALEEEALKKKENEEARQEELKVCARIIIREAFEPMFQRVHNADRLTLELSFWAMFSYNDEKDGIVVRFSNCKNKYNYLPNAYEFEGMGLFEPFELLSTVKDICKDEFGFYVDEHCLYIPMNPYLCHFKMELEP